MALTETRHRMRLFSSTIASASLLPYKRSLRCSNRPRFQSVPPEFLFAPADGIQYTREDACRVLAQQPFKGPSLPFKYLLPSPNTTSLRPPTLRYGWRFGHDKIMEIALKHFPDAVEYRFAPSTEGLDDDDDEQYSPEDYLESKPNISETLYSLELPYAIRKYLGLPDSAPDLIKIQLLRDSEGHSEWGLTVGSNYDGILKRVYLDKLDSVLETDEPPMWYLDTLDWRWYRVPPKKGEDGCQASGQGQGRRGWADRIGEEP
ncbi:hypothetical protein L226DRAFT_615181 [Lentinus tigrinus ALCF2SS1-7]|uniref:Uncharacterized protein n=1 Tax=Lentinus tigrinus ALCF2SS1-6 TaxID=1328759 RepID=A0A5C2S2F4_9APHY|nr:hypothetical protein L227DRAFT_655298 [Lentinus tigrinus ALCF2SS1-6]RPD71891.1 hypothetical protein L226DRAFT_615181 [Lentinus tigrinus ALCF2SS1-7]